MSLISTLPQASRGWAVTASVSRTPEGVCMPSSSLPFPLSAPGMSRGHSTVTVVIPQSWGPPSSPGSACMRPPWYTQEPQHSARLGWQTPQRDKDDRHFPKKISHTGRSPCPLTAAWEGRLFWSCFLLLSDIPPHCA